jgi:acyl-CoA synthetase (AMP-forming)/AMP-acid ligase II/thioesterase domain-containing protein/aryl carrier-like protein
MTIQKTIETFAVNNPAEIAVVCGSTQLSYAELNSLADQRASILTESGVAPGQVVAVCADRSDNMVVNILAVLKARATVVPINSDASQLEHADDKRLTHILNETKATAIMGEKLRLLETSSSTATRLKAKDYEYEAKVEKAPKFTAEAAATDLYAITYTSGSTGLPKGVPNNQQAILKWQKSWQETLATTPASRVAIHPNITFDAGLWDIFRGLLMRASIYLMDEATQKDPELLINFINDHHITDITLPPPIIASIDPSKITHRVKFVSTGAAFNATIITRFLNHKHRLFNGYGPTEVGVGATLREISHVSDQVPIGHPIDEMEFWFRETEHKGIEEIKLCKPRAGMESELYIGGPGLTSGYLNRQDLNAEAFVAHPTKPEEKLYKTGDIIRMSDDGEYYFIRRCKRAGKICGQLVDLDAAERVAQQHSALAQAAAVIRVDKSGNDRLICYYIVKTGAHISLSGIRKHFAATAQEYEIPSLFVPLVKMPLTPNGKIDYERLPAPDSIDLLRTGTPVGHRNALEEKLRQQCADLLGINPLNLGVKDNLLELGLKSLWAITLITKIADETEGYGVHIKYGELINQYNTIEALAAYIRHQKTNAPIEKLSIHKGHRPPVWCLHDVTGRTEIYQSGCSSITSSSMFGLNMTEPSSSLGLCQTLDDMAVYWIEVIRTTQPKGPYHLVGYSFGAALAQKIAYKLEEQGESVDSLHLIDGVPPWRLQDFAPAHHAAYSHGVMQLLLRHLTAKYGEFYAVSCEVPRQDLLSQTNNREQIKRLISGIKIVQKKADTRKKAELDKELRIIYANLLAPFWEAAPTTTDNKLKCRTRVYFTQGLWDTFFSGSPTFGWEMLCDDIATKKVRGDHVTLMHQHAADWAKDVQHEISPPTSLPASPIEPSLFVGEMSTMLTIVLEEQKKQVDERMRQFEEQQKQFGEQQLKQQQAMLDLLQALHSQNTPPSSPSMSGRSLIGGRNSVASPTYFTSLPTYFTSSSSSPRVSSVSTSAPPSSPSKIGLGTTTVDAAAAAPPASPTTQGSNHYRKKN